jgi:hypothetical protein
MDTFRVKFNVNELERFIKYRERYMEIQKKEIEFFTTELDKTQKQINRAKQELEVYSRKLLATQPVAGGF